MLNSACDLSWLFFFVFVFFLDNSCFVFFFQTGDNVHLKILVPSIAAGAIIGKGGETIAQVQKEAGARVKMSKANDFYPGIT